MWGNYIGSGAGIGSSGTNGTTAAALGLGTAGTGLQSPNGNDGLLVAAVHDNGSAASTYRAYVNGTNAADASGYFAAGSRNYTNAYYTSLLPSQAAPAAQSAFAATQGGATPAGVIGFAWHTFSLTQDGTNVTWSIDGTVIATVPNSAFTMGGSEVSLTAFDTGLTGSSAANNQLFNADIWDNLTVTAVTPVPEPATAGVAVFASLGLWVRLRQRVMAKR